MKHILLLMREAFLSFILDVDSLDAPTSCHSASSLHFTADRSFSAGLPICLCLIAIVLLGQLLVLLFLFRKNSRLRRDVSLRELRAADQLRFLRSLLDLCYAYGASPQVFLDKFKDRVNIRQFKSYDLMDMQDTRFADLKEDERLLCLLFERGFTQRELCVIFNLKKISNLYVKHHRIKKKLNGSAK